MIYSISDLSNICTDSSQSFVRISIFKLLFWTNKKNDIWMEWECRQREKRGEEKVTSRPLGKRVARKTKIELVNRFDNRWQSVEWNISIEWNLFNQRKIEQRRRLTKSFFFHQLKKVQIKFFSARTHFSFDSKDNWTLVCRWKNNTFVVLHVTHLFPW